MPNPVEWVDCKKHSEVLKYFLIDKKNKNKESEMQEVPNDSGLYLSKNQHVEAHGEFTPNNISK